MTGRDTPDGAPQDRPYLQWIARVDKPDGDDWTTVATIGEGRLSTDISAPDAFEAVVTTLERHWPVKYNYGLKGDEWAAQSDLRLRKLAGVGDHRITVLFSKANWHPRPKFIPEEGVSLLITEVRTMQLRQAAENRRTARTELDAARKALKEAQWKVRSTTYRVEEAEAEAKRVGATPAAIAKAKRDPRTTTSRPKKA